MIGRVDKDLDTQLTLSVRVALSTVNFIFVSLTRNLKI
jgi:hypothetical protein